MLLRPSPDATRELVANELVPGVRQRDHDASVFSLMGATRNGVVGCEHGRLPIERGEVIMRSGSA
jgi:hypothetical protein